MRKLGKNVIVYIDNELRSWLDEKSKNGYKMASFIRHLLRKEMEKEGGADGR